MIFSTREYSQILLYPNFEAHNIDTLKSGYKVEVEDINLDGRPNIVAIGTSTNNIRWYENKSFISQPDMVRKRRSN